MESIGLSSLTLSCQVPSTSPGRDAHSEVVHVPGVQTGQLTVEVPQDELLGLQVPWPLRVQVYVPRVQTIRGHGGTPAKVPDHQVQVSAVPAPLRVPRRSTPAEARLELPVTAESDVAASVAASSCAGRQSCLHQSRPS